MIAFRSFVFCVAVAATIAAIAWPWLGADYVYRELVVGGLSMHGQNKSVDYRALALLLVVSLLLMAALRGLERKLAGMSDAAASIRNLTGIALLPLLLWLGSSLATSTRPEFPYAWAIGAGTLLLLFAWRWGTGMALDGAAFSDIGELVLASMLLSFFAGCAVSLATFHASLHAWPRSGAETQSAIGGVMAANLVALATMFIRSRHRAQLQAHLQRWAVILQFALPLLGLVLLPSQLTYRGETERYAWPLLLLAALLAYGVAAWIRLLARLRRSPVAEPSMQSVLEPTALAMIGVYVTCGHVSFELLSAPGYPTLFGDDFHLGEQILPWQQLFDFHKIPYVEFAPVHGLMPIVTGALNQLVFDGTLATFNSAFTLLLGIASVATVLLACSVGGVVPGLAIAFLLPPSDRLLFVAPGLLLLAHPRLLDRPARWLVIWCVAALFTLGYNAAVGSALVLGTLPFALWMLIRAVRAGGVLHARNLLIVAVVVLLVVIMPPVRNVIAGFVSFVVDNGRTNTIGHAIPWSLGFSLPGIAPGTVNASRVLFELLRLSWIFVALLALHHALSNWRVLARDNIRIEERTAVVFSLTAGLTLVILAAWSIGRIDLVSPSRSGTVSFLAAGTLLPILYATSRGIPHFSASAPFALAIAIFATLLGLQERFSAIALTAKAWPRATVPADLRKVSDADLGGRRLGTVFVPVERIDSLQSTKNALNHVLKPGDTYFDLSNRQALYFYFDRPVPALYSATFNAVNETQQQQILRQLTASPPAAVLVAPEIRGDGIAASLRSFYLYRHFVREYRPLALGADLFLVNASSPAYPIDQSAAERENALDHVLGQQDLKLLPASWGQSWPTLQGRAVSIADLTPASVLRETNCSSPGEQGPGFEAVGAYALSSPARPEQRVNLLQLRLRDGVPLPTPLRIRYRPAASQSWRYADMSVRGNMLVVPMSSYPSWLLAPQMPVIDICVPERQPVDRHFIDGISAWAIPELAR